MRRQGTPRIRQGYGALVVLGLAALMANAATGPAGGVGGGLLRDWLYCGLYVVALAMCARRARHGPSRPAWTLASIGIAFWVAAEIAYRLVETDPTAAYPPVTKVLLGLAFAFAYATLVLLARERIERFDPVLALDGLIAGLTAVAVVAIWLLPEGASGHQAVPGSGTLLAALAGLCFVICVLGLTGWRPGVAWALIVVGILVNTLGDVVLVQFARAGDWQRGTIADPMFLTGALLLGGATLYGIRPATDVMRGPRRLPIPLGGGLTALAVLAVGAAIDLPTAAIVLAAAALAVTLVRMAVALTLLERSRAEAMTDVLTGLGYRRRLVAELERRLDDGSAAAPFTLALFDLDGFKGYNDRFGHLGGDALLRRLAGRLQAAVSPGRAFRMGGDEFCATLEGQPAAVRRTLRAARGALTEHGSGFSITASYGTVACPAEAADVTTALRLADQRMYRQKAGGRRGAAGTVEWLARGRGPASARHMHEMADLAAAVARRMGLGEDDVATIARAAALHDIGMIALPDEVLGNPGRLDRDERRLVERHPLIGERILRLEPGLAELGRLVRAGQERYDGRGYPDGLAGEQIPLGARIIAVCAAYDAMCSERPYRLAHTRDTALHELRRQAGRQFDPRVVAAFAGVLRDEGAGIGTTATGPRRGQPPEHGRGAAWPNVSCPAPRAWDTGRRGCR